MSRPLKRSFTLDGHRTSISLEAAFWDALQEVARSEGVAAAALVQRIDRERANEAARTHGDTADIGLSGALRVHLLRHYQSRAEARRS